MVEEREERIVVKLEIPVLSKIPYGRRHSVWRIFRNKVQIMEFVAEGEEYVDDGTLYTTSTPYGFEETNKLCFLCPVLFGATCPI